MSISTPRSHVPEVQAPASPIAWAKRKPTPMEAICRIEGLIERYERSDSSEAKHIAEFIRDVLMLTRDQSAEVRVQHIEAVVCEFRDDTQRFLTELCGPMR